jgi:hypothetical protein
MGPEPLPPLREQWRGLPAGARLAMVGLPAGIVAACLAVSLVLGATVAVLLAGFAAATAVYAKNRTDRHNAAVAEEARRRG